MTASTDRTDRTDSTDRIDSTDRTPASPEALVATRRAVHGLAEHVLAAHQRRLTRSIKLAVTPTGLRTARMPEGSGLALEGATLLRESDGLAVPLTGPIGQIARAAGVEFGLPEPPYRPASNVGPEDPADVDPDVLELLLRAWRYGDEALRRLAARYAPGDLSNGTRVPALVPVVWPEHLDVAITLDDVNYGVSPGDDQNPRPYAYVGPHEPRYGPFWNAPFGAHASLDELASADAVLAFFERGRAETSQG
jgi:hypothetical protein